SSTGAPGRRRWPRRPTRRSAARARRDRTRHPRSSREALTRPAYAIGIDFGTESGRALLLDLSSGEEKAVSEVRYPSGVIDRVLPPSGEELAADWALQDPDDWVAVIEGAVPAILRSANVPADEVVGLGIDVTSCTVLPVRSDGVPL